MREAIVIVLMEERDRERRETVVVVVCGWEEFWGRGRRKGKLF
jgi:hypothetical protein